MVNNDLISMWLDTSKSNLMEINNSDDTLHVRNYLSSPDTNKHQKDIGNKKTAPKLSSANPPPPSLTENGSNSNDARITACLELLLVKIKNLQINWLSLLETVWSRMLNTLSKDP